MKHTTLRHAFVEFLPEKLEEGKLYVSVEYATAAHKCCCGCGNDVVTPLSPNDWKLTYDGRTLSLFPSIGNWSFPCKSHYWIKNNTIEWARRWSDQEIAEIRAGDRGRRERYTDSRPKQPKRGFWATLRKRLTDD